jgi:hypothetical protein
VPFKPKHIRQFSEAELEALEKLNLNGSPTSPKTTTMSPSSLGMTAKQAVKVDLEALEKKAEEAGVNGHA